MLWGCQTPKEHLGRMMLQGSGFWEHAKAPHSSALASKGYASGLSPEDFTLGCRRLLEGNSPAHPLKSAPKQGERALPAPFLHSRQIPHGNGYFWALPGAIKSPVGAGAAVPQEEVVLPSASRHKQPERWEPKTISKQQPKGWECQKPTPGETSKHVSAFQGDQTTLASSPKQH